MLASQKEANPFNAIRTRAASEGQAVLVCRESNQLAHSGCQYAKTAYYETTVGYEAPAKMCEKHYSPCGAGHGRRHSLCRAARQFR